MVRALPNKSNMLPTKVKASLAGAFAMTDLQVTTRLSDGQNQKKVVTLSHGRANYPLHLPLSLC
jgi:hypothetical protein